MSSKSLITQVFAGEKIERVPCWFMRQAGRYLPEYRELRARHRMLDLIRTPELAFEVTMQPLRRFELDAAIIFADILNPLMSLGIELDFIEGEGPKIFNPIACESDIKALKRPQVEDDLSYTFDAIKLCVSELQGKNVPLLGFSGAPFTLSAYMIEGGKLGDLLKTKLFMFSQESAWHLLQERLIELIVPYTLEQLNSGAAVIQIFDSWAGFLAAAEYEKFVLPHLKNLIGQFKRATSSPLVYFSTGTAGMLDLIKQLPVDGFSIDWRTSISEARRILGPEKIIQGNLDPLILAGPESYLPAQVERIVMEGKKAGKFIFNLGHGIIPSTPPQNVAIALDTAHKHGRY